ncbi:EVE domain-containing protein [Bacillus sp. 123MFChir2]|uniref:EVE domain-containing protein n=1 Tax=Bacillus sp. 123MFChir2 TaxID=1169144 RepID=UPI000378854F|nr:EVE domain-containing protein [Bacillus sp. 123MFChir2]
MLTNEINYWIGVASRDHVLKGVEGRFAQLCHGKSTPLKRMKPGDWIIYYSSKHQFNEKTPCQMFTAIGKVIDDHIYEFDMGNGFIPFRRNIKFYSCKETDIHPLIDKLSFIQDKKTWGFPFRYGHLKISKEDFTLIAQEMGIETIEFH